MKPPRRAPRKRARTYPWYFRLIAALLPLVVFAGIEGALWIAGVAKPPPFFIQHQFGGRILLQINPRIGERFFPPSMGEGIPVPSFQVLPEVKPPGTRRILCLGESTTAGFPFPVFGSFPALLQLILTERDPSSSWEVTNCGLTAISSASVAEVRDELLEASPDILVVYMGHNEFYGAGGVGSRASALAGPMEALSKLRLVRSLRDRLVSRSSNKEPGTLMERLAAKSDIPPGSPLRGRAYGNFRRHLDRICEAAARKGVRVILCEMVSNERDLYPFGSSGDPLPAAGQPYLEGWKGRRPGRETADRLLPLLDREVQRDTLCAGFRYLRGIARLQAGGAGGALDLRRARNLDTVPFRAPDPVNEAIRETARRYHLSLVPTVEIFNGAAPDGIPGEELFVEHLHPTFLGSSLIASASADEILGRSRTPVTTVDAGRWMRASGLSRLDLALADARVAQLYRRWPYARTGRDSPPFPYSSHSLRAEAADLLSAAGDAEGAAYMKGSDPAEERLVLDLLGKRVNTRDAHKRLARERAARGDLPGARREYEAVVRLFPLDPALWLELGDVCLRMGDRAAAARAARGALLWFPGTPQAQELLRKADGGVERRSP